MFGSDKNFSLGDVSVEILNIAKKSQGRQNLFRAIIDGVLDRQGYRIFSSLHGVLNRMPVDGINARTLLPYAKEIAAVSNELASMSPKFADIHLVDAEFISDELKAGGNLSGFHFIKHRIFGIVDALCGKELDYKDFWMCGDEKEVLSTTNAIVRDNVVDALFKRENLHLQKPHRLLREYKDLTVLDWFLDIEKKELAPNKKLAALSYFLQCNADDLYPKKLWLDEKNGMISALQKEEDAISGARSVDLTAVVDLALGLEDVIKLLSSSGKLSAQKAVPLVQRLVSDISERLGLITPPKKPCSQEFNRAGFIEKNAPLSGVRRAGASNQIVAAPTIMHRTEVGVVRQTPLQTQLTKTILSLRSKGKLTAENLMPHAQLLAVAINERAAMSSRHKNRNTVTTANVINVLSDKSGKTLGFSCRTISILGYRIHHFVKDYVSREDFWKGHKTPESKDRQERYNRAVYENILQLLDDKDNLHILRQGHMPRDFVRWLSVGNDVRYIIGRTGIVRPSAALKETAKYLNRSIDDVCSFDFWRQMTDDSADLSPTRENTIRYDLGKESHRLQL